MDRSSLPHRIRRALAAWPLVALGLVFCVRPPHSDPSSLGPPTVAGMRAAIDPVTRDAIGMPPGGVDLDAFLVRSSAGLVQYRLPRGGYGVDLHGRFSSALVVRRRPDGSLESVCTDDHDHARDFLDGAKDPSTWEVE